MTDDRCMAHLRTAADVAAKIVELYGAPLASSGVLHPTAVWRRRDDAYVTLKITRRTPRSAHDFFVLNLARAWADAILTTGKNLRLEPELSHDLQGADELPAALGAYRRALGKYRPAVSLILTSGREFDASHPLLDGDTHPVIFTSAAGRERCGESAERRDLEIVSVERPSVRAAVAWLRRQGHTSISIEAGPSTATELYEAPCLIDELLLSIYRAPSLDSDLQGGELASTAELARIFTHRSAGYEVETADGKWQFLRYRRR